MRDNLTYLFAGWFLMTAALGFLVVREHGEASRLRQLHDVLRGQLDFDSARLRTVDNLLSDCEVTRAAIQKTANACGEGWAICEKRWGETGWR